jgi:hypothetical protein
MPAISQAVAGGARATFADRLALLRATFFPVVSSAHYARDFTASGCPIPTPQYRVRRMPQAYSRNLVIDFPIVDKRSSCGLIEGHQPL